MPDPAIIWDWLGFALRWLHVITAMAWIGSSFYFIALDLGLRRADDLPEGAQGEEWQVHGGGFYHIRKYLVAPARMPEHLTWFKWESYSTWLSGAALLMVIYWAGAEIYLIAPESGLGIWQGIAVSAASLGLGWVIYDRLCKSGLAGRPTSSEPSSCDCDHRLSLHLQPPTFPPSHHPNAAAAWVARRSAE